MVQIPEPHRKLHNDRLRHRPRPLAPNALATQVSTWGVRGFHVLTTGRGSYEFLGDSLGQSCYSVGRGDPRGEGNGLASQNHARPAQAGPSVLIPLSRASAQPTVRSFSPGERQGRPCSCHTHGHTHGQQPIPQQFHSPGHVQEK